MNYNCDTYEKLEMPNDFLEASPILLTSQKVYQVKCYFQYS